MSIRRGPVVLAAVVVVAAVVITIVASGGDGSGEGSGGAPPAKIEIRNGEPVGGVRDLTFSEGGQIRFTVRSDATHEIHLHGYDVAKEVAAGSSVRFDVPADIAGRFEAEIEDTATQIAEITVEP